MNPKAPSFFRFETQGIEERSCLIGVEIEGLSVWRGLFDQKDLQYFLLL